MTAPPTAAAPTPGPPRTLGKLLFASNRGDLAAMEPGDIYTVSEDGSGLTNLTRRPAVYENPTWSPDGTRIAFGADLGGRRQIYVMQADGSGLTTVPGSGPLDTLYGWAPDGRWLLVESSRDVNLELYAAAPDGSQWINLTRDRAQDQWPSWSPDGTKIAFVSDRSGEGGRFINQVHVLELATSQVKRLTDERYGATAPAWSPDGKQIAFSRVRDDAYGYMDVWATDADGSQARQLTDRQAWAFPETWSPEGRELIITRIYGAQAEKYEAAIVSLLDPATERPFSVEIAGRSSGHDWWAPGRPGVPTITLAAPPAEAKPKAQPLVLVNGTLIDGTGAPPVPDAVVVISGGRVAAAGPRTKVQIPSDAQVVDVGGATILPGFINAHVHEAYDARHLEAWAQAGVTTVRDESPLVPSRRAWQVGYALADATEDHPAYARIVAASPIMAPPGGYAGLLAVASPDDGRRKVDDILDLGADLIKIAFEDSLPPGRRPPLLGLPEAQAIVAEAHRRVALVSAHVTQRHHLERAVAAGVDDVAHMIRDDLPDALVAEMIRRGIYWVPTLELWQGVRLKGSTVANLAQFVAAGGQVALGTDYAGYSIPFQLGMPTKEIALMAEAGMSPLQIIVAATRNAAHVSGIADRAGTLEPGKAADILVVNGDPLSDLNALANVRLVLRGGIIIRQ